MSTYKKFNFTGSITTEQLYFFNKYGFIHFQNFASQETVKNILKSTEDVQQQWIDAEVEKINGIPIKYGVDENRRKIVQRFAFTNQFSNAVADFADDFRLNALKALMPEGARLGLNEKMEWCSTIT
jgi:phytanoyl-CoA hydroxylase